MRLASALAVLLAAFASRVDARPLREPALVTTTARQPRGARTVDASAPLRARVPMTSLAAAGWHALWDRETGVALRLTGGSLAAPGAMADPAIAERAARAFIAAHLDVLAPGASDADLETIANQLDGRGLSPTGSAGATRRGSIDGDLRTVGFRQRWHGLPVVGAQLSVTFAHDRLFVVGSEAVPNVAPTELPTAAAQPAAQRAHAEAWLTSVTGLPARTRAIVGRVVLPIVHARTTASAAPDIEYRVVDQLDVETVGAAGRWDVFVDPSGTAIARRDKLMTSTGTLTYDAAVRYPLSTRMAYPAGDANVDVAGNVSDTALDGTFTWSTADDPVSVIPGLTGALIQIRNQAGQLATTTLSIPAGGSGEWSLADDELGDAQLEAYIHAMIAKAHTHVINPGIDAWTNQPLEVYVNEAMTCNAYSTGQDIHFYLGDSTCENTGRLADVVFHEYGHSQHFNSIIPGAGAFNTPLSEGLADYNACDINNDSGMGRGFFFTNDPLRDIDPPGIIRRYPDDLSSDPHVSGEIISGALWDLRIAAIAQLGDAAGVAFAQKIFLGVMQRAADIPSSYLAALTIDDDDGDLGNGTPDDCAITRAFGPHGLAGSDFVTTTVGLPIVDGLAVTVPVTTPSNPSCPPPNVTAIAIDWEVGTGPHATVALTTTDAATWTGAIPPQPAGTVVTYTVTATLDDGSTITYPDNPADPRYELYVGAVTPIWCADFSTDPHWVETGLAGGEWGFGPPGNFPNTPDPTAAYTGTNVLGTDVLGAGLYRPSDMTTIVTPTVDTSAYTQVRLQYRRWLTVEDGFYDQATISANGTALWANAISAGGTLDHIDKEWRFHDVDLSAQAASGSVAVQWSLDSDADLELGGWTLDDVCIVGVRDAAVCGNGIVDPGEQCDDGNTVAGDGCSANCTVETATAGGGGCAAGKNGEDASGLVLGALGIALALARRKGRA